MSLKNGDLLNLFSIVNAPTSSKFQLFCRFLFEEDFDIFEMDEALFKQQYGFPIVDEMYDFYDTLDYQFTMTEGGLLTGGVCFGNYKSYDDALKAATGYTVRKLLKKFTDILMKAQEYDEKEVQKLISQPSLKDLDAKSRKEFIAAVKEAPRFVYKKN